MDIHIPSRQGRLACKASVQRAYLRNTVTTTLYSRSVAPPDPVPVSGRGGQAYNMAPYPAERDFKMVYCALSLRIIGSIYINHFETPTHLDYVGHNQKKDTHTLDFDVNLKE